MRVLVTFALLLASVPLQAAIIQVTVTGTVDRAQNPAGIALGDTLTMSYRYDSTVPDLHADESYVGWYEAVLWWTVEVNDFRHTYTVPPDSRNIVSVAVNYHHGTYLYGPVSALLVDDSHYPDVPYVVAVNFFPPYEMDSAAVFSPPLTSDALVPPPAGWGGMMWWGDHGDGLWDITANFEGANVQVQVIPLPATLWLLGSAVLSLGFARARRSGPA